jgi:hypothetical protein
MRELPNFSQAWDHENAFYLTAPTARFAKLLAHYTLFQRTLGLAGAIVECGVFKGASLARFAAFRELFGGADSKKIIAFDTFGRFPETEHDADRQLRANFVAAAGEESISPEQLLHVLQHKNCDRNVELVAGDIRETVPAYVERHPELRISLLNLDTDVYEPAVTILEHLYPRLVSGGVLMLDDYGVFPGETQAVDEYFAKLPQRPRIEKLPFAATPSFVVKP